MKKVFLAVTIIAFIITGCKKTGLPPVYIGTWKTNTGSQLTLNNNGTYSLTDTLPVYSSTGSYSVKGNLFTVTDRTGPCGDSIKGAYTYTHYIDSKQGTFTEHLTLSFQNDTCGERVAVLPATYDLVVSH